MIRTQDLAADKTTLGPLRAFYLYERELALGEATTFMRTLRVTVTDAAGTRLSVMNWGLSNPMVLRFSRAVYVAVEWPPPIGADAGKVRAVWATEAGDNIQP